MKKMNIVNVVATADLKQSVDLQEVSKLQYITYNQKKYSGRVAYVKTPSMFGKVSIFLSGKLISVGTKSLKQAKEDLQKTADILLLNKLIQSSKIRVRLRNIVALLEEPYKIDLEKLSNQELVMYEPEQFPSAILKHTDPKVAYLIFASGKIIILGAKSLEILNQGAVIIQELTEKYA